MPKRTDIKSILIIGSGPIVIGQACEFDYSGTQAIKALKEEGYRVILINSNPATIMTDPSLADATYIEPITPRIIEKIIIKEKPDAILPTMGGQTALNMALALDEEGILKKHNVELIGAKVPSIMMAEDRELFRQAMEDIGLASAKSGLAKSLDDARVISKKIGFPIILRPSRTLGGTGGGVATNMRELEEKVALALSLSPNGEVLLEENLMGWKEFELEVVRDLKDNVIIVCGIENVDPMGVHTGDSITVAPIQTLTDKEYQLLRDASIKIIRKIGVETGGSNVQFAINPADGKFIVIEMNPRVSRSSALASKATGFPIAKIAAKLAVGYTLDELKNDITTETPACFEPSIDYVVVKIPRFNFEKFPAADTKLGTQMKSVGEVLSFGRCFAEAMQKALTSMEMSTYGFDKLTNESKEELLKKIQIPTATRIWDVAETFRKGASINEVYAATKIDHWFLAEIQSIIEKEIEIKKSGFEVSELKSLKQLGFTDKRLSVLTGKTEKEVRDLRVKNNIFPSYKAVDTCAGEFEAFTPYLYSCYDSTSDMPPTDNRKVIVLGSGPNRIGQGIEFDYACVHAVKALQEEGYEAIMVNCNPETVSTDYDTSDRLYFEPLTLEHVLEIVRRENPVGVVLQFGGQTPLKLAADLIKEGVTVLGTSVEAIDIAEDRKLFSELVTKLKLNQPKGATCRSIEEAKATGKDVGYPLMLRPSFVLGGRAMRVIYSEEELVRYIQEGVEVSNERPVLLDKFLDNATEVDVDAVGDGVDYVIAGVMEHIEPAGIHSGDSSCALPPTSLSKEIINKLKDQARILAAALKVKGLLNVQFAVSKENEIFVIEANPRASRTVPFVGKATGIPWAKIAAKMLVGRTIKDLGIVENTELPYTAVKSVVFPFGKFSGVDPILGPEMKSTGEVMGIDAEPALAIAKAFLGAGIKLPKKGRVFVSVMDNDKRFIADVVKDLQELGFDVCATRGTAKFLETKGLTVTVMNKVLEGSPHIVDSLRAGAIQLVINTPEGQSSALDSRSIRLVSHEVGVATFTNIQAAAAGVRAIKKMLEGGTLEVKSLQDWY